MHDRHASWYHIGKHLFKPTARLASSERGEEKKQGKDSEKVDERWKGQVLFM